MEEELRNLFFFIDREETGTINAQDLWNFVKDLEDGDTMTEKDIDKLMNELDQK